MKQNDTNGNDNESESEGRIRKMTKKNSVLNNQSETFQSDGVRLIYDKQMYKDLTQKCSY